MVKWLSNGYDSAQRHYTVTSNNAKIRYGIPQGSAMGPLLFTRYTSGLPKAISHGIFLRNYNYWGLVSMRAFSTRSSYW